MSQIPVEKIVFNKNEFPKVVDTQFRQLFNGGEAETTPTFTLEDFFTLYEELFYQIPKEGDSNSHAYLLQREADYLGVKISSDDLQALLSEITTLRQEILLAQQTIQTLSTNNGQ